MSKLVRAEIWTRRHFEPMSEPAHEQLKAWALAQKKGVVIDNELFIKDDALAEITPPTIGPQPVTASSLLSA